jgi:hypothetical protein
MNRSERVILQIKKGTLNANFKTNSAFEKEAKNIIGVRWDAGDYAINNTKSISESKGLGIRVLLNPNSQTKQFDIPLEMFLFKQPSNLLYLGLYLPVFDTENSGITLPEAFEEDKIICFTFFFK